MASCSNSSCRSKWYGYAIYCTMLLAFSIAAYFLLVTPEKGFEIKKKSYRTVNDAESEADPKESVAFNGMTENTFAQLLKGYNNGRRPFNNGQAVPVLVEIMVSNIFGVSEVNNEFSVEIYFRQYWRDERVALEKINITNSMFLSSNMVQRIWIPSTYFVRSKREILHKITTDNVLLKISPNGDIFYSQRLSITSSCVMNLKYFPHDRQRCNFTIESYAYPSSDVIYRWHNRSNASTTAFELLNDNDMDLPSFYLEAVILEEGLNKYTIGSHSYLVSVFKFKRRLGYFLIETYVPSCIIVAISWVSFWIPPESAPARVSLGITTVLTMTTISSSARQNLPKVSYVKAIDWFLLACLVFVFGALIEFAFVSYNLAESSKRIKKDTRRERNRNMDQRNNSLQKELSSHSAKLEKQSLCSRWPFGTSQEETFYSNVKTDVNAGHVMLPDTIDRYARRCFPLAFVLFNVIYWLRMWLLK